MITLSSKNGRRLPWMKICAICAIIGLSFFIIPAQAQDDSPSSGSGLGLERVTFDLGGSFGSIEDQNGDSVTYSEIGLGLNLYFAEWLAWRNAVFGRFASGFDNVYGLDTSVRGILNLGGGALGLTAFAGPGYRFLNEGINAPFVEGGLVVHLAGISLGGGVKSVLNSAVRSRAENDVQYFIILAGGGSL